MSAERGAALVVAMGGSSDIVGAHALALALGYSSCVLVQPGSPPRGDAGEPGVRCTSVHAAPTPAVTPGGRYFDNANMVAYLLASEQPAAVAGYYLTQPKDSHGNFTTEVVQETADALVSTGRAHGCTALVAIDFGGDVALPDDPGTPAGCFHQRDLANLRAAATAAAALGIGADALWLVAAALGVDGASVAPAYHELRQAGGSVVMEMTQTGALERVAGEPPSTPLPVLPAALVAAERRLDAQTERRFVEHNSRMAKALQAAAPEGVWAEHVPKTYALVAATHAATLHADEHAGAGFFVVGAYRGAEKARPLMHSSYALQLFDLGWLVSD